MIDYTLFGYFAFFVMLAVMGGIYVYVAKRNDVFGFIAKVIVKTMQEPDTKIEILLGGLIAFPYVFVEAILLSLWGTTPGKALLGIRLRKRDGTMLTFSEGLKRAFRVWIRGVGLGIPIVQQVMCLISYNDLVKKGETPWDYDGNLTYSHQIIGSTRIFIAIAILVGNFLLMELGRIIRPG